MKSTSGTINRKIKDFVFLFLILSIYCLPQSFSNEKIVLLGVFFFINLQSFLKFDKTKNLDKIFIFYLLVATAGIVWALVGLINNGNSEGIDDGLRLFVLWSLLLAAIFYIIRSNHELKTIHQAIVVSGIVIAVMNIFLVINDFYGMGFVSDNFREETNFQSGFMDGFIRINSNNIGSLFFIVPYLVALQFRKDSVGINDSLAKISLALTLLVVVMSGRRALWICTLITPLIIFFLSHATRSYFLLKKYAVYSFWVYLIGIACGSLLFVSKVADEDFPIIAHVKKAFSSEDERSLQVPYLIDGFIESPIFGSGFGGYAGYLRSDERPWTYEATYHQLLFNFGIVGIIFFIFVFMTYLFFVINSILHSEENVVLQFCIMTGYFSLLIGIYSNPYIRSFDYLFTIGLLPYLATFKNIKCHGIRIGEVGRNESISS